MRSSADTPRTTVVGSSQARKLFWAFVNWLRKGYADDAPATGHCSLIALHGPISISEN